MKKKIMSLFGIALMMLSLMIPLMTLNPSAATIAMENADFQWETSSGDIFIYHIFDDVVGERYVRFETNGTEQIDDSNEKMVMTYFTLDLDTLEFIKYCDFNVTTNSTDYWRLSGSTGVFVYPLLPVNTTPSGQLDLDYWGKVLTAYTDGNSYGYMLNLTEYNVVQAENRLELYNSSSPYYCNMTFYSNGTLSQASVFIKLPSGVEVKQTIIKEGDDNDANPIDATQIHLGVGDEFIVKVYNHSSMTFHRYIITSIAPTYGTDSLGLVYIGVNATKYTWSNSMQQWVVDGSFISQCIGGGNDFHQVLTCRDPWALIVPEGYTGADLNISYGNYYSSQKKGGYNVVSVGPDWVMLVNASDTIYIRINMTSGLTVNASSTADQYAEYLNPPLGTVESVEWAVSPGDYAYYKINDNGNLTYRKATVDEIYSDYYYNNVYDWMLNASIMTVLWEIYNESLDAFTPSNTSDNRIGAANNTENLISGNYVLFFKKGTTGEDLNDSVAFQRVAQYFGMDYIEYNDTYIMMNNASGPNYDPEHDLYVVYEFNSNGEVLHSVRRLTDNDEPDGFDETEYWKIEPQDFPDSIAPVITHAPPDQYSLTENEISLTLIWTADDCFPDSYIITMNGTAVATGNWNIGQSIEFQIPEDLAAGTYVYEITFTDASGNEVKSTVIVIVEPQSGQDSTSSSGESGQSGSESETDEGATGGGQLSLGAIIGMAAGGAAVIIGIAVAMMKKKGEGS